MELFFSDDEMEAFLYKRGYKKFTVRSFRIEDDYHGRRDEDTYQERDLQIYLKPETNDVYDNDVHHESFYSNHRLERTFRKEFRIALLNI